MTDNDKFVSLLIVNNAFAKALVEDSIDTESVSVIISLLEEAGLDPKEYLEGYVSTSIQKLCKIISELELVMEMTDGDGDEVTQDSE